MIGETLGSYRLVKKLGQGGMGVVYVAEHTMLGKLAAVKLLLPEHSVNPEVVNRFFNEAKAATQIKHAGIVDVYDFGKHANGSAYIVMELLDGESLADRLKRGPIQEQLAVEITRQVATALAAAHTKGIVHRDLKPDNIFLVPDAAVACGIRAKILDFGIAKLAPDVAGMKTRTGALMGTPVYMSPEQCRGVSVDSRSDIYSLGCIVYEMFAGRAPFGGEGLGDILAAHIYERPQPLTSSSPEIANAVSWALAKNPADRPQTLNDFAAALAPGAQIPAPQGTHDSKTLSPGAGYTSSPQLRSTTLSSASGQTQAPRSGGTSVALVAVVGLMLGGGGVGAYLFSKRGGGDGDGKQTAVVPKPDEATAKPAATPPAAPVPSTPAPAPAKTMVKQVFQSDPPGAEVYRPDGKLMGRTPLTFSVEKSEGENKYRLHLSSYDDVEAYLSTDHDDTADVKLKRRSSGSASVAQRPDKKTDKKTGKTESAPSNGSAPVGNGVVDPFAN